MTASIFFMANTTKKDHHGIQCVLLGYNFTTEQLFYPHILSFLFKRAVFSILYALNIIIKLHSKVPYNHLFWSNNNNESLLY